MRTDSSTFAPPYRALWEITWKCDLRCEHCLVSGGSTDQNELSSQEAFDLVDDLARLGVSVVSLTGGEPLLRPDWHEIAARIKQKGMILRFSANGHLLSDQIVKKLIELDTESFSVSIDGVKKTHDRIRHGLRGDGGASSFDRVMQAIARLRETPIITSVRTTVTKQNTDELPEIHKILKASGAERWVLQLAHRSGRLLGDRASGVCEPIDPAQLPQVADFIVANADDPILQPRAFNSIGYLSRKEPIIRKSGRASRNPIWRGCRCGVNVIGIEPDGGIKGCANQVGAPFVVGNIRQETLQRIWSDRDRWHWVNPTPDKLTGECADCALGKVCQAGCTVLSYRSSGELFNNPYCLRRIEKAQRKAEQA
jgi:radical SAM protein with 4Fe4S-binding SPASM domain